MLTLYHAPTTRSFRIKWLLLELGVHYDERVLNFYSTDRVEPEYLAINSQGSIPAMTDGSLTLTESGAIVNHIIRTYGNGRFTPGTPSAAAQVDEWMYWSEGLFAVHQRIYWDHCAPPPGCVLEPVPSVGQAAKRQAIRYAGILESALASGSWIVGDDLTGAEFMLSFPLFLANLENWFETLPGIAAYVDRIQQRPAFQQAIADTMAWFQESAANPSLLSSFRAVETQW